MTSRHPDPGRILGETAPEPTFDANGYPTDDTLRTLRELPHARGFGALMRFVKRAWRYHDMVEPSLSATAWARSPQSACGDDEWWSVSTGGWSGNESIIAALEANQVFWTMCWFGSRRGGHYVFHIPPVSTR